jgi:hypothetical protein
MNKETSIELLSSGDSSVGIATGLTAGVQFPAGTKYIFLLHSVHIDSGTHPASYTNGIRALSPGIKL